MCGPSPNKRARRRSLESTRLGTLSHEGGRGRPRQRDAAALRRSAAGARRRARAPRWARAARRPARALVRARDRAAALSPAQCISSRGGSGSSSTSVIHGSVALGIGPAIVRLVVFHGWRFGPSRRAVACPLDLFQLNLRRPPPRSLWRCARGLPVDERLRRGAAVLRRHLRVQVDGEVVLPACRVLGAVLALCRVRNAAVVHCAR
jgi:hypothetical protein